MPRVLRRRRDDRADRDRIVDRAHRFVTSALGMDAALDWLMERMRGDFRGSVRG